MSDRDDDRRSNAPRWIFAGIAAALFLGLLLAMAYSLFAGWCGGVGCF